MSPELTQIVEASNDITAFQYYGIATTAIFFYEYFTMLPDEIQYAWSSNKTWVFYLFLLNRYIPMAFQFWFLDVFYKQGSSREMYDCVLPPILLGAHLDHILTDRCNKTGFISILTFVICTLIAQIVLTLRIYAVTGKSRPIAAGFAMIIASQLTLGIYLTFLGATSPPEVIPSIPFEGFKLCVFSRHRGTEIAYAVITLTYDLLAFLVILCLAGRSMSRKFGIPGLLGTIVRDATTYFFVIFTGHFVLTMTVVFARSSIRLLPAIGTIVYVPVMITRLMISLRKAARSRGSHWSMAESTVNGGPEIHSMRFAINLGTFNRQDDDTLLSPISPRL